MRNNSLIFRTGVSCFSVILFYSTLLALTHRQKDRQRVTLATRGLEEHFSSCVVVSKTIRRKIMWSQFLPNGQQVIWDLAGTGTTLFSGGLFWDWLFLDLRIFFGACFRYKLICYNLYHVSDLCKIVQFLRKIECIVFECNEFVLVLVQFDLIHIEHSNCISSTWTKTNTNSLHSRSIDSISHKIGHVIQIVVDQFVRKTISTFKLY